MANVFLWFRRIILLLFSWLLGILAYDILVSAIFDDEGTRIIPIVLLWALTAYIVLPRVHRFLTRLYLPDYFIGRVRTGDGLLGDPVNLAVTGTKLQLVRAMKADGWHLAEPITFKTSWRMVVSTLLKRSYPTAPVSNLFLFGKQQDLAFQKEVNGNPHARHHVRFWKVPAGWYLPGGYKTQWVGAATYDRRVGFSLFTGQVTHKIAENTDEERDYVADSLAKHGRLETIKHFSTAYHSRNGGGDSIKTDGVLQMLHL